MLIKYEKKHFTKDEYSDNIPNREKVNNEVEVARFKSTFVEVNTMKQMERGNRRSLWWMF